MLLILTTSAAPAFSHTGHTSIFHSHSGIEYLIAYIAIASIAYRLYKK